MPRVKLHASESVAIHGLFVVFGLGIAAFFPFVSLYLAGRGLTPDQIGLVIAIMALARLVTNPVWGHVADTTIGRVTALRLGSLGVAAAALSMNLVEGFVPIAAVSFVLAGMQVAGGPNLDAIALAHLGDERMTDYGRIRAWESMSYAAGCLTFGAILQAAGIRWAMPIFGVASLGVVAWSVTLERDRPQRVERHGRLGTVGAVFRAAPRLWGFLVAILLVWTGFNAAWNFIALKIADEGGGPMLVGFGLALGGLVEVPTMRVSSRLQARWGLRRVFVLGCLVYATGFLLWGTISNPTIVSMLAVFEGLAFALLFTTGVVVVGRLLPSNLYSTGNALAQMVGFGIGPIIGAGIGGFVYQEAGPVVLYAGASVLAVGGAIAAWIALSTPALSRPSAEVPEVEPGAQPEPGLVP
ncbi:MAG TPA: MFS transporter [Actinomycetota bacterium]|nr:MFS transporter [Actinomycetota bacterium]